MTFTMAALSLVCAILIAVFVPTKRMRTSVPHLAIALWLGGFNLIHGINAFVWAGNINIHIPVWCDIMTKLMLGTAIALPGAFLCIAMELRLMASDRKISTNPVVIRNRKLLEVFLCYILPALYMASHLIVQDYRFDIVRDLGCSAATHPSTLGFLITWIPPIFFSCLVFVFFAMALHNAKQPLLVRFNDHLQSRCSLTSSIFYRRLAMCLIMTGSLCVLSFSALFSVPRGKPWISFASVHATMGMIRIVQPDYDTDVNTPHGDLLSIQIAWWGMFVVTVIYVALSFAIGEESRDAYRWIKAGASRILKKKPSLPRDLILPVYNINLSKPPSSPSPSTTRSSSSAKSHPLPLTLDLKSGWDDSINEKTPRRMELLRSPRSQSSLQSPATPTQATSLITGKRPVSPSMRSVSPSPTSRYTPDEDKAFMESTMNYLGSPTAKSLGLSALQIPPPALSPPARMAYDMSPVASHASTSPSTPVRKQRSMSRPSPKFVPEDIEPTIGSVLNERWPLPPTSPTPSLSSSTRFGTRSRSHSPASSAEEIVASALPSGFTNPPVPIYATHPGLAQARPFDASSISSFVVPEAGPPPSPSPAGKMASLVGPGARTLGKRWSRERLRKGVHRSAEGIQMTVVHETV